MLLISKKQLHRISTSMHQDVNAQLLEHINLYFPINVALLESSESLDLFVDSMFEQVNSLDFKSYAVN